MKIGLVGIATAMAIAVVAFTRCAAALEPTSDLPATPPPLFGTRGIDDGADGPQQQAIQRYDEAIRQNPNYAEAYESRALAYQDLGNYEKAIGDLDETIRLRPNDPTAYYYRGTSHFLAGEYQGAIADAEVVLRVRSNFAPAIALKGHALYALGRYEEAAQDFARVVALDPDDADRVMWLHFARIRSGVADADEFRKNALRLDRQSWPGFAVGLYLGQVTPDQLRLVAQQGNPKWQSVRDCISSFYLGEYSLLAKDYAAARPLFESAATVCPPSDLGRAGATAELKLMTR